MASAGLPAHPGTFSKNPIPVFRSNAICVKTIPTGEKPLCVQWCINDALIYEEREEEVEEEEKPGEMETGLESLVDKYGLQKIMDTVARMSHQKGLTCNKSRPFKIVRDKFSYSTG